MLNIYKCQSSLMKSNYEIFFLYLAKFNSQCISITYLELYQRIRSHSEQQGSLPFLFFVEGDVIQEVSARVLE